ncbi:MAG: protein-glutamate O-methyltransferase CheR [Acidimicrobiia bacterium]|nr:protein-glutamate O-methyltransferase CheR [Acidimicrobiia bacterium]
MADDRHPLRRRELEAVEIDLLAEGIYEAYGFDFRRYSRPSFRRRVWRRVEAEGLNSISGLLERVLHDPLAMKRLVADLSVNVSAMFRDPGFFRVFRDKVVPQLRTYPFLRVWNAGCATGEETLSVAILLKETGLYDRTRLYATDMNDETLDQARSRAYPIGKMREYTANYIQAGGIRSFSEYYVADGDRVVFQSSLADNIVFAQHNLVTDRSFNEFHVIMCRNVMIYFDRDLQEHVHKLLYESLTPFGVLGLGSRESVEFSGNADAYEALDDTERLYRKVA